MHFFSDNKIQIQFQVQVQIQSQIQGQLQSYLKPLHRDPIFKDSNVSSNQSTNKNARRNLCKGREVPLRRCAPMLCVCFRFRLNLRSIEIFDRFFEADFSRHVSVAADSLSNT